MKWEAWIGLKLIKNNKSKIIICLLSLSIGLAMFLGIHMGINNAKNVLLSISAQKYGNADFLLDLENKDQLNTIEKDIDINQNLKEILPFSQDEVYYFYNEKFFKLSQLNVNIKSELDDGTLSLVDGRFPQKGEALISELEQKNFSWQIGDTIEIKTKQEIQKIKISGIIKNQGIGINNKGDVLVQDVQYAPVAITEYKVILKNYSTIDLIMKKVKDKLGDKGRVIAVGRKSGNELKEIQIFFCVLYGFSIILIMVGLYIVFVTLKNFYHSLRQEVTILKVLGAKRKNIVQIFLSITSMIALISICFGGVISVGIGKLLFSALKSSLRMENTIPFQVPVYDITFSCAIFFLAVTLVTLFFATKYSGETIIEGLSPYPINVDKKIKNSKLFFSLALLVVGRILLPEKIVPLISGIICAFIFYWFVYLIFPITVMIWKKLIEKILPEMGLMFYSATMKLKSKSSNILFLFILLSTAIISSYSVFYSFNLTLDRMINEIYYGDAIVTASVGSGVDSQVVTNLNKLKEVKAAIPIYQEYRQMDKVNCQIIGMDDSEAQGEILSKYDGITQEEFEQIQSENSALVSNLVMKLNNWKSGRDIEIKGQKVKIVGTYSSPRNDGKSIIVSQATFKRLVKKPVISFVKVIKNNEKISDSEFVSRLNKDIISPYVNIKNLSEQKAIEKEADKQFIIILKGILGFFAVISLFVLINAMMGNKQDNLEADNILYLLGTTKGVLVKRNIIEGLYYVIISSVFSIIIGVLLSKFLIAKVNVLIFWNLPQVIDWQTLFIYLLSLCLFIVGMEWKMTQRYYSRR